MTRDIAFIIIAAVLLTLDVYYVGYIQAIRKVLNAKREKKEGNSKWRSKKDGQ